MYNSFYLLLDSNQEFFNLQTEFLICTYILCSPCPTLIRFTNMLASIPFESFCPLSIKIFCVPFLQGLYFYVYLKENVEKCLLFREYKLVVSNLYYDVTLVKMASISMDLQNTRLSLCDSDKKVTSVQKYLNGQNLNKQRKTPTTSLI